MMRARLLAFPVLNSDVDSVSLLQLWVALPSAQVGFLVGGWTLGGGFARWEGDCL